MQPSSSPHLVNPLETAVRCAALTPALRSVLLFDADSERLEEVAQLAAVSLQAAEGVSVERVYFAGGEDDDRLFGSFAMVGRAGDQKQGARLSYVPGPLDQSVGDPRVVRLVLIPELTRLGLAAVRACITLMGAPVAHLQRYDRECTWQPNLFWIAACPRAEVGSISLHLLDRFALRIDGKSRERTTGVQALRRFVAKEAPPTAPLTAPEELREAADRTALMGDAALDAVLRAFPTSADTPAPSLRRPIALAWLALALARLEGAPRVLSTHVAEAAALVGLTHELPPLSPADAAPLATPTDNDKPAGLTTSAPELPAAPEFAPLVESSDVAPPIVAPELPALPPRTDSVLIGDSAVLEAGPLGTAGLPGSPYPEDSAPAAREATPLRLPIGQRSASRATRGTIIGVMRADSFHDIALTATLIEACKYQAYRRRRTAPSLGARAITWLKNQYQIIPSDSQDEPRRSAHVIVHTEDLRRYRRVPPPERLLVLLLDYTCLDEWDWGAAVLPYLTAAYVERAAICIIQVGAADARSPLRASQLSARSLLAPAVASALAGERGGATPLAHGLVLAHEALRRTLHHGRTTLVQAQLVILTDGRGNVPLAASRDGVLAFPVGRQGVEDALTAAAQLKALPKVKTVLIHPSPRLYRDLPVRLGQALGAEVRALVRGRDS